MADKKISGFRKFSEMKKEAPVEEVSLTIPEKERPNLPNLPDKKRSVERMPSRKEILPDLEDTKDQNIDLPSDDVELKEVKFYGKVAKFPNRTKASKAYNFLENVKISKSSIWYILVEKQDNELQMIKYNNKQGFDMNRFVLELKGFYIKQYHKSNPKLSKLIESIEVNGVEEFSTIRNIPNITIGGKKLITKITEDLIHLLGK